MADNNNKLKKQIKKLRNVKWLLPGWVGFEYYKISRNHGLNKKNSLKNSAKAEAMRISALSIPLPGSYELATTTMALLKNKLCKKDLDEIKFSMLTNEIMDNKFVKYKIGKYIKLRKPINERKFKIFKR